MTDTLFWAAYVLGGFKLADIVELWPDGLQWVLLGFATLTGWLVFCLVAWGGMQ